MTPAEEQLGEYVSSPKSSGPPPAPHQPSRGKRLPGAIAAVAIICIGVATFIDTKAGHSPPRPAGPPRFSAGQSLLASPPFEPASSTVPPKPVVSPVTGGSAEGVFADLPSLSSYTPRYGARFNAATEDFGPVDATVTHLRPGEYTVDFPKLADVHNLVDIRANDSGSICYSPGWQRLGVDERVTVRCVRLVRLFPTLTTAADSRFTIAVSQLPTHDADSRGPAGRNPGL